MTILNINRLEEVLRKYKHDTAASDTINVLPFTVNRSKEIRIQFNGIIAEFVRNISGIESPISKKKKSTELQFTDPLVSEVMKQINFQPDYEADLERLLKEYLYGQEGKIRIFHPYIYNHLPPSDKIIFKKYGTFISNIFAQNNPDIQILFENKETDDLLSELILNNLETKNKQTTLISEYQSVSDLLPNYFKEDLLFISRYREYFLNNIGLLIQFYTLMYVCQMLLIFDKFESADETKAFPLYFALEWEALNKRRKAADDLEGFKLIKSKYSRLFVHLNTLSQLSHNSLFIKDSKTNKYSFQTYKVLKDKFDTSTPEIREQFLLDINEWIKIYTELFNKKVTPREPASDISSAFVSLFECISQGVSEEATLKYGRNIEDVAGSVFLKSRGSLGSVFNMNHDMLMLLTAICVKDNRMPLKELFMEYEKRGVTFDRLSKKAVFELLDSHNIIDKKSDSGDAQYVKPIL